MDAFTFIRQYKKYVNLIEMVIKPELQPVIQRLKNIDPRDIVTPNSYFYNEATAMGHVWKIFLSILKQERIKNCDMN